MKLTKEAQRMMDILEEHFSNVTLSDPVATLSHGNRTVQVTQELFDYGGAGQ